METRDRWGNVLFILLAGGAWGAVIGVVTSLDPTVDPAAGPLGAGLIGLASGLTAVPLFWLLAFARQRRIAYRGDWRRAARRGAWVALVVASLVLLRLQGALSWPIALFIVTMVAIVELSLSESR